MEESMNIVDYKSKLDSLTNNLLSEYMKLETMYLRDKHLNINSLSDVNSKNSSMCDTLSSKTNEIKGLEKEIEGYKYREQEYNRTIDYQRNKIKELEETKEQVNKFDMLRSQSKEISEKDKEIERLTKELIRVKEMNDMKKNITIAISDEPNNKLSGWSSPPFSESTLSNEVHKEKSDNDDDSLFEISYRKKKYYRDNDNKVYLIEDNEELGDCIGDWVKQENGKFKLVKS